MAFQQGNQFWKQRTNVGRKRLFSKPETLWEAAEQYFEWVEQNPLWEDRLVTFQGHATHEPVAKMRAMTIEGLCLFLNCSVQTWYEYKGRDGFSDVITRIEAVMNTQKFTGAAADLLNSNIIARHLGLSDKTEVTGKDGGPIQTEDVSARERIAGKLAGIAKRKATDSDTE